MFKLKNIIKSLNKKHNKKCTKRSSLSINLKSAEQLLKQYKIAKQYILSNLKNMDPTVLASVYKRLLKATPKSKQIPKRCKLPKKLINLNSKNHQYTKLFLKPFKYNKHLSALNIDSRNLDLAFNSNDGILILKPQKMNFNNLSKYIKFCHVNSFIGLTLGSLITLAAIADVISSTVFNVSTNLNTFMIMFMVGIVILLYGFPFLHISDMHLKHSEATSKDIIKILDQLISNLTSYIKINSTNLNNLKLKNRINNISKHSPHRHLKNIKSNGSTWKQIAQQLKAKNKDKDKEFINN